MPGDEELPSEKLEISCLKNDLGTLINQLPELQGKVLRLRYGIEEGEPMTLTGISKLLIILF